MIVRSARPESHFLLIRNDVVRDDRLSYRARGVLAFVLSQPDGYRASVEEVAAHGKEGREAVRSAQAELIAAGYVVVSRRQAERGRWETDVTYFDEPQPVTQSNTTPDRATGSRGPVDRTTANRAPVGRASADRGVRTENPHENPLPSGESAGADPAPASPLSKVEEAWREGWSAGHSAPAPRAVAGRARHVARQSLDSGVPEPVVVAAARAAGLAGSPWVDRYVADVSRLPGVGERPTPTPPRWEPDPVEEPPADRVHALIAETRESLLRRRSSATVVGGALLPTVPEA